MGWLGKDYNGVLLKNPEKPANLEEENFSFKTHNYMSVD